jgi:hypothetical protein
MEDRIFHHFSAFQVLDNNALEKRRGDMRVPDAIGIDDHYRATTAHAEAGSFSALDPAGPEKEAFALKQRSQMRVELPSAPVGRAEAASADDHVARIRLHYRIAVIRRNANQPVVRTNT